MDLLSILQQLLLLGSLWLMEYLQAWCPGARRDNNGLLYSLNFFVVLLKHNIVKVKSVRLMEMM